MRTALASASGGCEHRSSRCSESRGSHGKPRRRMSAKQRGGKPAQLRFELIKGRIAGRGVAGGLAGGWAGGRVVRTAVFPSGESSYGVASGALLPTTSERRMNRQLPCRGAVPEPWRPQRSCEWRASRGEPEPLAASHRANGSALQRSMATQQAALCFAKTLRDPYPLPTVRSLRPCRRHRPARGLPLQARPGRRLLAIGCDAQQQSAAGEGRPGGTLGHAVSTTRTPG